MKAVYATLSSPVTPTLDPGASGSILQMANENITDFEDISSETQNRSVSSTKPVRALLDISRNREKRRAANDYAADQYRLLHRLRPYRCH